MSALFSRPTASVFIEFTETSAHVAAEDRALDIALERDSIGALTHAAAESVRNALKLFVKTPGAEQVICLLPARGVSIRRISLPASSSEEIERLLPLQIDAHFPLSSEELAWGYTALPSSVPGPDGTPLKGLLVAAVKKDALQQYREIISAAGFAPIFAIAALAREGLCSHRPPKFGVLDIGQHSSELLTFDESGPATLRVISLGGETLSAEPLLATLRSNGAIEKIFVSGKSSASWSSRISPQIPAEPLPIEAGGSHSIAISGMRETLRRGHEPLLIHANREAVHLQRAPTQWRWAAAACLLLLVSLGLRYAEPLVRKARLNGVIAQLEARRAKLPKIDREAGFLNFIHTNQPVYLDVLGALAGATQPGMKLDSLSISRRGEISLRGSAQGGQAATSLRSKMIDSGYFANVVIDEQTPVQNQQQVNFRMSAQLRPDPAPPMKPAASTNKPAAKAPQNIAMPMEVQEQ